MLLSMSQKLKSPLLVQLPRRCTGVKQLDNPYRAIIDAGVIVGLSLSAAIIQPLAGAVDRRLNADECSDGPCTMSTTYHRTIESQP